MRTCWETCRVIWHGIFIWSWRKSLLCMPTSSYGTQVPSNILCQNVNMYESFGIMFRLCCNKSIPALTTRVFKPIQNLCRQREYPRNVHVGLLPDLRNFFCQSWRSTSTCSTGRFASSSKGEALSTFMYFSGWNRSQTEQPQIWPIAISRQRKKS